MGIRLLVVIIVGRWRWRRLTLARFRRHTALIATLIALIAALVSAGKRTFTEKKCLNHRGYVRQLLDEFASTRIVRLRFSIGLVAVTLFFRLFVDHGSSLFVQRLHVERPHGGASCAPI